MKKWSFSFTLVLMAMLFLAGCATPYQIVLKDGSSVEAVDEPEYNDDSGFYEYETLNGKEHMMNKDVIKVMSELE